MIIPTPLTQAEYFARFQAHDKMLDWHTQDLNEAIEQGDKQRELHFINLIELHLDIYYNDLAEFCEIY